MNHLAVDQHARVFGQANGGTLFLDEICDMPLAMQVKLLRVQDKRVVLPVSLRLVCATHRNLKTEVEAGRFHEDLYYRINVIHLAIPPLHERGDDIPWLAQRFLDEINRHHPASPKRLGNSAQQALLGHAWPGNVRELRHAIERAAILSDEPELTAEMLLETAPAAAADEVARNDYLAQCEARHIRAALARHGGRITETAMSLGISRKSLWKNAQAGGAYPGIGGTQSSEEPKGMGRD